MASSTVQVRTLSFGSGFMLVPVDRWMMSPDIPPMTAVSCLDQTFVQDDGVSPTIRKRLQLGLRSSAEARRSGQVSSRDSIGMMTGFSCVPVHDPFHPDLLADHVTHPSGSQVLHVHSFLLVQ